MYSPKASHVKYWLFDGMNKENQVMGSDKTQLFFPKGYRKYLMSTISITWRGGNLITLVFGEMKKEQNESLFLNGVSYKYLGLFVFIFDIFTDNVCFRT